MKYINLDERIKVSEIGLGTMTYGQKVSEDEAVKRMDDYYEYGGNFFDTANIYGKNNDGHYGGQSEILLGKWIKSKKNREKIILATKVGFPYDNVQYGTSKKQIIEELDKSLKRLKTDYIDLYYLHTDDRSVPLEETLEVLQEFIKQGKVRSIGASNFTAWRLQEADCICEKNSWKGFSCIQQRHTYLRPKVYSNFKGQRYVNQDLEDYLKCSKKVLISYCPLIKGFYTNNKKKILEQYDSLDSRKRLEALDEVSKKYNISKSTLVYYWLMYSETPSIPLVAPSNKRQWEEIKEIFNTIIKDDDMYYLSNAGE